MDECSSCVALVVRKDRTAVSVALPGREEPVYRSEIGNLRMSRPDPRH